VYQAVTDQCFRPEDECVAACIKLAERGWLEQRRTDANCDLMFRWSQQAEAAMRSTG
jgi:hypothetical protein